MTYSARIYKRAQKELLEAIHYFKALDKTGELAAEFERVFFQYQEEISANPFLYAVRWGLIRRANLNPRFHTYYIAYVVHGAEVVILGAFSRKARPLILAGSGAEH